MTENKQLTILFIVVQAMLATMILTSLVSVMHAFMGGSRSNPDFLQLQGYQVFGIGLSVAVLVYSLLFFSKNGALVTGVGVAWKHMPGWLLFPVLLLPAVEGRDRADDGMDQSRCPDLSRGFIDRVRIHVCSQPRVRRPQALQQGSLVGLSLRVVLDLDEYLVTFHEPRRHRSIEACKSRSPDHSHGIRLERAHQGGFFLLVPRFPCAA